MASNNPKPLTLKQLCEAIDQGQATIRRWIAVGCPHHKAPGRTGALTFDRDEVVSWMRAVGRTGEAGRPAAEASMLGPVPGRKAARQEKAVGELSPEEIRALGAIAAVQVKQLEVRKRERLEREAEGELVALSEVQRWWTAQVSALTTALEALPGRVATEAAGRPHEDVYAAVEREVTAMRERLASEALRG